MALSREDRRIRIKRRIRKTVTGTSSRPRLSVFRSNKQIYAQLIDDVAGVTLGSASSVKNDAAQKGNKVEQAKLIGKEIARTSKKGRIRICSF